MSRWPRFFSWPRKRDSGPPDRPLRARLRELGLLSRAHEAGLPRFLILGSEHSGARQLSQLMRRDPACSFPATLGTQFFSSRYQWCDLDWYLRALGDDAHLVRGEWTPGYRLLPVATIRLLAELVPGLKLVFLLGDPAVEAWYVWRGLQQKETQFTSGVWARADVFGQLRRWQSVFPAAQFFVGFEHKLRADPHAFLEEVGRFLGMDGSPAARENCLPHSTEDLSQDVIPPQELALLREVWRPRTEELSAHLKFHFQRQLPAEWTNSATATFDTGEFTRQSQIAAAVANREFDDVFLHRALAIDEMDSNHVQRIDSWCGFDVYLVNQRVAAVPAGQNIANTPDVESKHILWADDLASLRHKLQRSHRAFGFSGPDQVAAALGFVAERLTVYGDDPVQLVQDGYRGFNILRFRQQFWAIPRTAGAFDPSRTSERAIEDMVRAELLLPAPSLEGALAAVDAFLLRCPAG